MVRDVIGFNNSDPRHAKVNPLRARRDKPHLWFQDGYWRVSPLPILRRRQGSKKLWNRAQNAAHVANYKARGPHGVCPC